MSQDLRIYCLSLFVVLMLWTTSANASYGSGSGCGALAIPVSLTDGDIWHVGDMASSVDEDFRDLYPYNTAATVRSGNTPDYSCVIQAQSGTYYDGANHLWVLDKNLVCSDVYADNPTKIFRIGDFY